MSSVCLPLWQNTFSIQEINHIQYNTYTKGDPTTGRLFSYPHPNFPAFKTIAFVNKTLNNTQKMILSINSLRNTQKMIIFALSK